MRAQSPTHAQAREAIARAADATGVDFQYLMAQARLESGLDPSARAGTSSAAGLFQFTNGTWLGTLDRHGARHGLSWVSEAIEGGRIRDPGLRSQVLGLRYDADASARMAAELARDNGAELTAVLGRAPDATELYLAHFLGAAGAGEFLGALARNPGQSAAALLPKAAAANRAIFYEGTGVARSVGGVMNLLRTRMASAMGESGGELRMAYDPAVFAASGKDMPSASAFLAARSAPANLGPLAREFHSGASPAVAAPHVPARSMAETLKGAFGASEAALPGNVKNAYGKLARFGL
ncbi:lytic transglycosylase domain-containing protein [Novosphingobium profundi]|uniref:lytic transglycosylase domain-containing protein n=1 Tax=Novosphingobium profundi TaxID=1774954 RepID=UPI001CFDAABA|nr:lytic transglycosylase domain-containing protein [Novosphingobium profundi]